MESKLQALQNFREFPSGRTLDDLTTTLIKDGGHDELARQLLIFMCEPPARKQPTAFDKLKAWFIETFKMGNSRR